VICDRDIPECKGVPRHLRMTKYVSLHNDNIVAVVEGICHNVSSNLIIGTLGPPWETQLMIRY
jgi:hypothetical protein